MGFEMHLVQTGASLWIQKNLGFFASLANSDDTEIVSGIAYF